MSYRKAKQTSNDGNFPELSLQPAAFDGATDSTSPSDEIVSPTKADRSYEYSKKQEMDPSKRHVSVTVPGVVKPKLTAKKKKVAPTVVSSLSSITNPWVSSANNGNHHKQNYPPHL